MPLLSVDRVRELLGPDAEGKSDAEVTAIRDRFARAAQDFVALCETRERDERRLATSGAQPTLAGASR